MPEPVRGAGSPVLLRFRFSSRERERGQRDKLIVSAAKEVMAAAGKSSEAESPSMVDRALNELRLLGYTVFKGKVLQDQTLLEFEWQG